MGQGAAQLSDGPPPCTGDEAAEVLFTSDLDYLPMWPSQERVWELRRNVSAYDACY